MGKPSLPRMWIDFEQFEKVMSMVALSKADGRSVNEKVLGFFQFLAQFCGLPFVVHSQSRRQLQKCPIEIEKELNKSSSSLDISIKEALKTITAEKSRENSRVLRVSTSPRPGKLVFSNRSTPKSTQKSLYTFEKSAKSELEEFLKAEQEAHADYFPVPPFESARILLKTFTFKSPAKSTKKAKKTLLRQHENYLKTLSSQNFSHRFILSAIFLNWKNLKRTRLNNCT